MKNSILRRTIYNILSVLSILIVIVGWVIYSKIKDNELIFPTLSSIFKSLGTILTSCKDLKAILFTILRVFVSVIFCQIIGYLIAVLYIRFPISLGFFKPLITIMRSTPIAIISIFIFIVIGSKLGPLFISIIMTLPIVFENLILGIDEIPIGIKDELSMLPLRPLTKITKVYFPSIKSYIIMSIVQSIGMSFKVLIMGEYICQTNNSIGKNLYMIKSNIDVSSLISYGIIIVFIVCVIEIIISKTKQKMKA